MKYLVVTSDEAKKVLKKWKKIESNSSKEVSADLS